jgi:endonuclease YncB( thermonuclease family)
MRYFYSAHCDRVIDGDTIEVTIDLGFDVLKRETVRFAGLDSPETRTSNKLEKTAGLKVEAFVKNMLEGKDLFLNTIAWDDKYGRYLAVVYLDEEMTQNVNQQLLDAGYVLPYDGKKKSPWLDDLLQKIINSLN